MERINQIYASVAARKTRPARVSGIRTAATVAQQTLEDFLRQPSKENLKSFERAEVAWARLSSGTVKCFADELRALAKQGTIVWKPASINTNSNTNYNPYCGFVYAMWSTHRPNNIKLGVTSRHPTDRQAELKKRMGFAHLDILFFFEIGKPRDVEHELHKRLGTYLDVQHQHDSREWFRFSPSYALDSVQAVIDHLKVKRFPTKYINQKVISWTDIDFWPTGQAYFGGIRALENSIPRP